MFTVQRLTHCEDCPHTSAPCATGLRLLAAPARSIAVAAPFVEPDFSLSGKMWVADCERPCRLGWTVSARECRLFAEMIPEAAVRAPVILAQLQGVALQ